MIIYEERQKFNQWWLWAINLVVVAITAYVGYDLVRSGASWPELLPIMIGVGVIAMLAAMTLKTTITEDGIRASFFGIGQTFKKHEIERAYVREYQPLGEYGGWGYRVGRKGTAYNVMGKQGLQLILHDGKRVLIGTQNPEKLERVIKAWMDEEELELGVVKEKNELENLL